MSGKFPFAIVIDGTTVLPHSMRRELDMRTLPLHVSFGLESYTADVDLTSEQFYEKIKDPKAKPTTSQPSIGECRQIFEDAQRDGYTDMLVLTVATEFSGTFSVATTTAQQIIDANIVVVDSRSTASSIGLIATACAKARRDGKTLAQTVELAKRLAGKTKLLALIDTLDFLKRSGRISGAAAAFGSLISLKGILDLREGRADAIEKVRTREKGVETLKQLVESRQPPATRIHAAILHANAPDRARLVGDWVQERYHCVEFWVDEAGPVLASHAGPGTVALGWYPEETSA